MIPTVANFRKNGVTQVKCPRCRTAQPLYQEGDHIEEVGFGGPYSVNHDGVVHPDFVCMRHVNGGGKCCDFAGAVRLQ